MADDFLKTVHALSESMDADLLAYFGDIERPKDDELIDLCRNRVKKKNVILFLTSRGGDPNAAYRIARCLQVVYSPSQNENAGLGVPKSNAGKFSVLVNSLCKSAGTLIALGADQLYMTGNAELGPLDIQLRKPDEVGERTSGLTPVQAIRHLDFQATSLFKSQFTRLRFDNDLLFSTKMAAELATSLTTGLLSPIYGQIDPIRLAEVNRSLAISSDYADRISRNLKPNALEKLVTGYPSHGFVIDREEAKDLFRNVSKPTGDLFFVAEAFKVLSDGYLNRGEEFFAFLNDRPLEEGDGDVEARPDQKGSDGSHYERDGAGDPETSEGVQSASSNENVQPIRRG